MTRNINGLMTGKNSTELNSVLPLDARTARIAAGGGLASSLHEFPAGAPDGFHAAGTEPDDPDPAMPPASGSRTDLSRSVPRPSVHALPVSNSNPT